jgi:hypothetical protein
MQNWYASPSSGGQGLIACTKTGETIAVSYDVQNAALISAAPAMLAALRLMYQQFKGNAEYDEYDAEVIEKAREAIAQARGQA